MKEFIKQNWFKISFLILIAIFVPIYLKINTEYKKSESLRKEKIAYYSKQTLRCEDLIKDYRKREEAEGNYLDARFGYNPEFDYCIYSAMSPLIDGKGSAYIKNLFTNEEIAWLMIGYEHVTDKDRSDFEEKEKMYLEGLK